MSQSRRFFRLLATLLIVRQAPRGIVGLGSRDPNLYYVIYGRPLMISSLAMIPKLGSADSMYAIQLAGFLLSGFIKATPISLNLPLTSRRSMDWDLKTFSRMVPFALCRRSCAHLHTQIPEGQNRLLEDVEKINLEKKTRPQMAKRLALGGLKCPPEFAWGGDVNA